MKTQQNVVVEIALSSAKTHAAPQDLLDVKVGFTAPDKSVITVNAYWAGSDKWIARYSSPLCGTHTYLSECADTTDNGLHEISGSLDVEPYAGSNPLYSHGALSRRTNPKYMTYRDGTPFFWLADTWWMSLCDRISFPDEFSQLVSDRVEKGFTVVQVIAGLYPDMHWYDERGKNPAGYPWSEDFAEINPAYFDDAEKRIQYLVENGITPCIVGCWGYFMKVAGREQIKRHWRYLLARFAAYPVAFCIAGEANMAFYDEGVDPQEHLKTSRSDWNDVTQYVRDSDPFRRLITIHPTQYGHEQIDNPELLDMDMLQTGHGGYPSLSPTLAMMKHALSRGQMPVIDSEVCYEGIMGSSYSDVQRYAFLSCMFLGAAGHTYGANGIWQLNGTEKSYGPSPHGAEWGRTSWKDAAALPGSGQIGACKKYLSRFEWWKMRFNPEWAEGGCGGDAVGGHFAMGIEGEAILVYKPNFGGSFWGDITIGGMTSGCKYRMERFDCVTGEVYDTAEITADENGRYHTPRVPVFGDWIISFVKV